MRLYRLVPLCLAAVFSAALTTGPLLAQSDDPDDPSNRPPSLDGSDDAPTPPQTTDNPDLEPPMSPGNSAVTTVTASQGQVHVTAGMLNPGYGGYPVLMWLEVEGPRVGQVILEDGKGTVVWRKELHAVRRGGELVAVPRPGNMILNLILNTGGVRSAPVAISLYNGRQLSLPLLVVGGEQSLALAEELRGYAGERPVHWMPPSALPATPAVYLGVAAVVLGPDARIPEKQGLALRLFHCARGGVVSLGNATLPTHGSCQDPPVLVGEHGRVAPHELMEGLREFQVTLGMLEEQTVRGMQPMTDAQAASGLLAHRPDARMGLATLVLVLLGMAGALYLTRRQRMTRALLVQASVPVVGGVVMAALAFTAGAAPTSVRLVTVDAREGAPVALVRTAEATVGELKAPTSETAWVIRTEPKEETPTRTQETWDAVDVVPLNVSPNASDGSRFTVSVGGPSSEAFRCGSAPEESDLSARELPEALGRVLLERCLHMRGVVTPLAEGTVPQLPQTFSALPDGRSMESRWLYVLPQKGKSL
ncbi:MAG: hypothetical protein AB2A00_13090 [Myxococcota bacterium]